MLKTAARDGKTGKTLTKQGSRLNGIQGEIKSQIVTTEKGLNVKKPESEAENFMVRQPGDLISRAGCIPLLSLRLQTNGTHT
jgi:hypothetical protein